MKTKHIRFIYLIIGSIILGMGIAIGVQGGQGTDSLGTFWDGMSRQFSMTVGQANILFNVVLLLLVWFLDKKQLNIGTIISPVIAGISTDLTFLFITGSNQLVLQIIQSTIGVILIGIGVGVYTAADIGKSAYDAMTFSLSNKFEIKYFKIRMGFDLLLLILGYILGGSIGVATIIAVLIIGYIIQNVNIFLVNNLEKRKHEKI